MTDQELDQLMRQILLDAVKLDMEEFDSTGAVFVPSARYQKQMAAMQRNPLKWMRQKVRPLWKQVLRQAAMIMLAVSVGFGCVMAVVPSARAAVVQWFLEWYDTYVVYRYRRELPAYELPVYTLTWLPEGYQEVERVELGLGTDMSCVYQDNEGNCIYFDYWIIDDASMNIMSTENVDVISIMVGDYEGLYFGSTRPEQMDTITWIDPEAGIQFQIDANIGKDGILHIAEAVSLVKIDK